MTLLEFATLLSLF